MLLPAPRRAELRPSRCVRVTEQSPRCCLVVLALDAHRAPRASPCLAPAHRRESHPHRRGAPTPFVGDAPLVLTCPPGHLAPMPSASLCAVRQVAPCLVICVLGAARSCLDVASGLRVSRRVPALRNAFTFSPLSREPHRVCPAVVCHKGETSTQRVAPMLSHCTCSYRRRSTCVIACPCVRVACAVHALFARAVSRDVRASFASVA